MKKQNVALVIMIFIIGLLIMMTVTVRPNTEIEEPIDTIVVGADSPTTDYESGLENGNLPPDFELPTLSGDIIKLTDYKGKKVILNFWASWCGPCKAEMPHMQNYYEKNKDSANVEIIAVNLTAEERGPESVEKFVDVYGLTFPIPLDNDGKVMDMYRIMTIPTTYMIGTDGTIKHMILGPMDEKRIKELVDNLD